MQVRVSEDAWLHSGAPLLGTHTAAVLAEAGYSPSQVDDLLAAHIVAQAPVTPPAGD